MYILLVSLLGLILLITLVTFYFSDSVMLINFNIFTIRKLEINLRIYVDFISRTFAARVLLISLSVIFFSSYYLIGIPNYGQFYITLIIFIFSILTLIFRPNIFSLILGWDGLGVSSYLLVIFYKSTKSLNAGLLTGVSNRVGDGLILISLGGLVVYPFLSLPALAFSSVSPSDLVLALILVATRTKRAQLPFRAWLPAAIAAPTPVSALVHSSTLVTAGIYLLLRVSSSIPCVYLWLFSILGVITIILARLRAIKETDGKKIVALSTLSQLGVIVTGFRFSLPRLVFFHLLTHAFFKALLFIRTGYLIHNNNNYQDLRRMGGGAKNLRMNLRVVIRTKARLAGLPFFAAFYSKESLLESLSTRVSGIIVVYMFMLLGVVLTLLYSIRFMLISTYFISRRESRSYIRLKSPYLRLRRLLLFFPRIVSGKFLFFILAQYSVLPLVRSSAKSLVIILLVSAPLFYHFKRGWVLRLYKFYSHMWGLPLFVGRSSLKGLNSLGLTLMKRIMFSLLDYVIFAWVKNRGHYSSIIFLNTNANVKLSVLYFVSLTRSLLVII